MKTKSREPNSRGDTIGPTSPMVKGDRVKDEKTGRMGTVQFDHGNNTVQVMWDDGTSETVRSFTLMWGEGKSLPETPYVKGQNARRAGKALADNPVNVAERPHDFTAWEKGWLDANRSGKALPQYDDYSHDWGVVMDGRVQYATSSMQEAQDNADYLRQIYPDRKIEVLPRPKTDSLGDAKPNSARKTLTQKSASQITKVKYLPVTQRKGIDVGTHVRVVGSNTFRGQEGTVISKVTKEDYGYQDGRDWTVELENGQSVWYSTEELQPTGKIGRTDGKALPGTEPQWGAVDENGVFVFRGSKADVERFAQDYRKIHNDIGSEVSVESLPETGTKRMKALDIKVGSTITMDDGTTKGEVLSKRDSGGYGPIFDVRLTNGREIECFEEDIIAVNGSKSMQTKALSDYKVEVRAHNGNHGYGPWLDWNDSSVPEVARQKIEQQITGSGMWSGIAIIGNSEDWNWDCDWAWKRRS